MKRNDVRVGDLACHHIGDRLIDDGRALSRGCSQWLPGAAVGNDPDEPRDLFGMLLRAASAKTAQPAL
ncbi:MAG: hypothetical protein E5W49_23890 [Mesorhizobium sp.]|nr:MAG: hypothetical protein EOS62_21770 [Mesorhizobium sp.]TIU15401.1 MAG: hypothetical protein E5W49_23890 [Mesorhizobium sp.]